MCKSQLAISWLQPRVVWGIQPSGITRPSLHCRIENKTATATQQSATSFAHQSLNQLSITSAVHIINGSITNCSSTQLLKPKASVICPLHICLSLLLPCHQPTICPCCSCTCQDHQILNIFFHEAAPLSYTNLYQGCLTSLPQEMILVHNSAQQSMHQDCSSFNPGSFKLFLIQLFLN